METLTTAPLCQGNIGSKTGASNSSARIFAHQGADGATAADREQIELNRIFMSAGLAMTAKGITRAERAFATQILLQIFMRRVLPSAADIAAVDALCDRVLAGMRSRLAQFVVAERRTRRALIQAQENAREALARSVL